MRSIAALAAMLLTAGRLAAQAPEPGLPRVVYGAPPPSVVYGPPSAPEPPPRRATPPPAAMPPQPPQGTLSYQQGPAYLPPGAYWTSPPGYWAPQRPPPPAPTPYVSPRGGMYEPPMPQGRYVGRPPSAPPELQWPHHRPSGR